MCADNKQPVYILLSPLIQVTTWDKQLLLVGSCVHVFLGLRVIVYGTYEKCVNLCIYSLTGRLCGRLWV